MDTIAILLFAAAVFAGFETPWEAYLALPTSENATVVSEIAYTTPRQGGYDADDLAILQTQVAAADSESFRLAFRLYQSADGGLAEELGTILAGAIRSHPRFFLQQVVVLDRTCQPFKWALNSPGLEYADRPDAAAYELSARLASLNSVEDRELASVRANCVRLLAP